MNRKRLYLLLLLCRHLLAIVVVYAGTAAITVLSGYFTADRDQLARANQAVIDGLKGIEPLAVARDFYAETMEMDLTPVPDNLSPGERLKRMEPRIHEHHGSIVTLVIRTPMALYHTARNVVGKGLNQCLMTGVSLLLAAWALAIIFGWFNRLNHAEVTNHQIVLFVILIPLVTSLCAWILLHAIATTSAGFSWVLNSTAIPTVFSAMSLPAGGIWDAYCKVEKIPDPLEKLADWIIGRNEEGKP